MLDVTRFWYKRGVAGSAWMPWIRCYEDPKLTDNPVLPGTDKFGRPNMDEKYDKKLPEVHDAMRKLRTARRRIWFSADRGDVDEQRIRTEGLLRREQRRAATADGLDDDGIQGTFTRMSTASILAAVNAAGHWPVYVISNHDIMRSYTRYADGAHNDDIAKMMAALYLTLRGIGDHVLRRRDRDGEQRPEEQRRSARPGGKLGWPLEKGRDGERTPMQWTDGQNAGFSKAKPWLPVPPSAKTHNVAGEMKDQNSVLRAFTGNCWRCGYKGTSVARRRLHCAE